MNLKRGDQVLITNKDNIKGTVIGFYAHSQDAVIETKTGNQWIVSPLHLKKLDTDSPADQDR